MLNHPDHDPMYLAMMRKHLQRGDWSREQADGYSGPGWAIAMPRGEIRVVELTSFDLRLLDDYCISPK